MADSISMHRLTNAATVVVCRGTRRKLELLNAGSIIIPKSAADSAGMIEATCKGLPVIIFARDLEERSIEIAPTEPSSVEMHSCQPTGLTRRLPRPIALSK